MPNQIQTIKFKKIRDDAGQDGASIQDTDGRGKPKPPGHWQAEQDERGGRERRSTRRTHGSRNFSFEYSYPAVIFDGVCFSVDKSQQQANFLEECIYRASRGFAPLFGREPEHTAARSVDILKSVDLSVPYGSIFGLLGPSSCGKTTLLRCLVGLLKPTSGSVRLFGHELEDRDGGNSPVDRLFGCARNAASRAAGPANKSKVPGMNVGYMPQDLGLYEDFTIRQILTMFGRYMRMDTELIGVRIEFMAHFLELPDVDRQIESLSGGQKRRVSFAIACLHMPPLIILDEPTVGVDPLLRRSIWKYLRRLANEENKTIIITTHYIEEAAQADQVALMRGGQILVQDTPERIMQANESRTLEEAFLKICNNISPANGDSKPARFPAGKLCPQPRFDWTTAAFAEDNSTGAGGLSAARSGSSLDKQPVRPATVGHSADTKLNRLKLKAQQKLELFAEIESLRSRTASRARADQRPAKLSAKLGADELSMSPNVANTSARTAKMNLIKELDQVLRAAHETTSDGCSSIERAHELEFGGTAKRKRSGFFNQRTKLKFNSLDGAAPPSNYPAEQVDEQANADSIAHAPLRNRTVGSRFERNLRVVWALLYKNYRRNVNSIPLLAFQFMLPIIQMISFSLCVGGRPTDIGLGLINNDRPFEFVGGNSEFLMANSVANLSASAELAEGPADGDALELLSLKYLDFVDKSMISIRPYDDMASAIEDVRRAKLWAVMEIGANFTTSIARRFDLENFYQLDADTIRQSVIRLYPDRSNKILDMICTRSLVDSYRKFLLSHFEHFRRLPIEVKEPIFDIGANVISNSIDGYTESIAPGLLASLTYIMAAGLTTFIMVVERGAGILERTYTCGINPVAYLVAHAVFRSFVMMLQIGCVLALTFFVLRQPLVGSLGLAYLMLMTLNLTGIAYGLLISSLVTDQNGAALTIVSSLVVKITLSGILWPLEAIPGWLRSVCYANPLTMPVQALKSIILKGSALGDRAVNLGFLVSLSWLLLFITVSARRFKFYQH